MIFQGIRTSIAKKPYIYIFLGGWRDVRTPCPTLGISTCFVMLYLGSLGTELVKRKSYYIKGQCYKGIIEK